MNFLLILENINPLHILNAIVAIILIAMTTFVLNFFFKRIIKKEKDKNDLVQVFFNRSPYVLTIVKKDMSLIDCSDEASIRWGYKTKQDFLKNPLDILPEKQPDGSNSVEFLTKNILKCFENGHLNFILWTKDTKNKQIPIRLIGYKNEYRGEEVILCYSSDVSDLYKTINREKEAYDTIEHMFRNTPLFIERWDRQYNLIDSNDLTWNFWGFETKEEYIKNFTCSMPDYQPNGKPSQTVFFDNLEKTFEQGKHRWELVGKRCNETLFFDIHAFKMSQNNEEYVYTYAIDITETKLSLEKMFEEKKQKEKAEEVSKQKSRFLAQMSHEIRTPLTAILGISEIHLQQKIDDDNTQEAFSKIYSSSNVLLGIVNNILDLSKIESGHMPINKEKYSLSSFIGNVVQLNISHLYNKNLNFIVKVDPKTPENLIGDYLLLNQILNNVISNSIKYTQKGYINLYIGYKQNVDSNFINLSITIKDTGRGMTPEQLDRLGSDYTRFVEIGDNSTGTGLGMSITKSLIRKMNGTINIESELNKGTNVYISIPQEVLENTPIGEETAENLSQFKIDYSHFIQQTTSLEHISMPYGKVLVVDDVDTNLYVAKGLLEKYELQVETVNSGKVAIEKIMSGKVYDIIFMDQMMPQLDGIETTNIIRNLEYNHPIIVFTADAMYGQAGEYIKNGFDSFMSKPIKSDQLHSILKKYIYKKQKTGDQVNEKIDEIDENIPSYLKNMTVLKDIHEDFVETCKNTVQDVKSALDENDIKTAHLKIHTTKGLASLILEKNLANICEQIEALLKVEKIPDNIQLDKLSVELDLVLDKIENYVYEV